VEFCVKTFSSVSYFDDLMVRCLY